MPLRHRLVQRGPARLRAVGALTSLALAAGGLGTVLLPSAAHADAPASAGGATLTWAFSPYLETGGQLAPINPAGGASIGTDAGGNQAIVFGGGQGMAPKSDGVADVTYSGSIEFAATHNGSDGTPQYEVTFSDPEVKTDGSGSGQILADVSWNVLGTAGSADNVPVVTFGAELSDWDGRTLTATPDWAGVAPDNTYGTGKPVDGQSWDTQFVLALPSAVRAFFYASGSGSDATKAPATFTAEAEAPQVTYETTSASYADGLTLSVHGTGFRGVTNPGDAGVYVGLAPAGGLPDVSSQAGMAAFAGAAYVPTAAIADGAFSTTLNAPRSALDRHTSYSLYTWQAHSHSNTTQDTETPVTIDWSTLAAPQHEPQTPTLTLGGATSSTYGTPATITATLPADATGTVTLTGAGTPITASLAGGKASFALPATLAPGSYTASIGYAGDDNYASASATRALSVAKATSTLTSTWKKKPTVRKKGKLTVTVAGVAGAATPTGTVKAVLTHGAKKVKATGSLKAGRVVLKLKRLPKKGTWKIALSYAGDTDYAASSSASKVKAKK